MAAHILGNLSANNLFDLTGVVAVVTGGGTVSSNGFSSTVNVMLMVEYHSILRA